MQKCNVCNNELTGKNGVRKKNGFFFNTCRKCRFKKIRSVYFKPTSISEKFLNLLNRTKNYINSLNIRD